MRREDPRAGFTLVEVLAALVVTAAFVAVVLPFAGRLATHWWVGEGRVEVADSLMQAISRLGDDVSQAVPVSVPQNGSLAATFRAGADFIQFVRPALGRGGEVSLETVRFEIRASAHGHALIRRAGPFRPLDPSGPPDAPTMILDGAYGFRFRAYGADHAPRLAWADEEDMPAGVELTITGPAGQPVLPGVLVLPITAKRPALSH